MAGFSTLSAWMFLFLQLNVILSSRSTSNYSCTHWNEFHKAMGKLKPAVESCSENCSTTEMTVDRKCRCLNLTVSSEDCASPGFFIKGVEALNTTLLGSVDSKVFPRIIWKLKSIGKHCKMDFLSVFQREMPSCISVTIISPKVFVDKLKNVGEELTAKLSLNTS